VAEMLLPEIMIGSVCVCVFLITFVLFAVVCSMYV
jgi:hypothetical protein